MMRRTAAALLAGMIAVSLWTGSGAQAQPPAPPLDRYYYYPYYYFPHNYWPTQGPKWPEPIGSPYMRPPAYMAYPPFKEPGWHYEAWEAQRYYRGSHFWLDQF